MRLQPSRDAAVARLRPATQAGAPLDKPAVRRLLSAMPTERVRLRTAALPSGVTIFRVSQAAVPARLRWLAIGEAEHAAIRRLAHDLVNAVSTNPTRRRPR